MRAKLLTVGVAALLFVTSAASADPRSETRPYGLRVVANEQCVNPFKSFERSTECFALQGDEVQVSISVRDDVTSNALAGYSFCDSAADSDCGIGARHDLASGYFCGKVENVAVPDAALKLTVTVMGPVWGPAVVGFFCANALTTGAATTGTLTVTYGI